MKTAVLSAALLLKRVRLYRDSVWAHRRLGPARPLASHRQQNRDHQRPAGNDRHLPRQPTRSQQSGLSRLSAPSLPLRINAAKYSDGPNLRKDAENRFARNGV